MGKLCALSTLAFDLGQARQSMAFLVAMHPFHGRVQVPPTGAYRESASRQADVYQPFPMSGPPRLRQVTSTVPCARLEHLVRTLAVRWEGGIIIRFQQFVDK
jgi:hypothetical protein